MLKIIFAFAVLNALGMTMMIYFDKKKSRPMGTPLMYAVVYVIATVLDVLVAHYWI